MRYFCTYFDRRYLPRGLALYRSLRDHCRPFRLHVLCLDQVCRRVLDDLNLPEVETTALAELEEADRELTAAKADRSLVEYYFTLTPAWSRFVLERRPEVDLLTYLDSDLYFFNSPEPLFEEFGSGSTAIIGHRFSPEWTDKIVYGRFNVGWISFRRDENGLACLEWWRRRCLEWCYDRLEGDRFADQKYLDQWPDRFKGVVELKHQGGNVAPWNVFGSDLSWTGRTVTVNGQELVFYHFFKVKQLDRWTYDPNIARYGLEPSAVLLDNVYGPYLDSLAAATETLRPFFDLLPVEASVRAVKEKILSTTSGGPVRRLIRAGRRMLKASNHKNA